ncbi:MAG TPA: HNH endonuclease [Nitrosopumilaceae archaeon]|jgi:hypothetical protein|nr:HNH endonuclease [Nitrosopumilaceae archaeon]
MVKQYHTPKIPPNWVLRRIVKCLKYNPKTGNLIWITNYHKNLIGKIAGAVNGNYIQICFHNKNKQITLKAHHICWFLYYGEWPPRQIDHEDTNGLNNKIRNLRLATSKQNRTNQGSRSNNKTGIIGVCFDKNRNKYRVQIAINKKQQHLGFFTDLNQAKIVRRKAEKQYYNKFRYKQKRK